MMPRFIQLAVLLVCTITHAQAQSAAPLPRDAATLKQSYLAARAKALKPLDDKYRSELERLLAQHTKAGALDAALAIRAELDTYLTATSETTSDSANQTVVGEWCYTNSKGGWRRIFLADGTVQLWKNGKEDVRPEGTPWWVGYTWKPAEKAISVFAEGKQIGTVEFQSPTKARWLGIDKAAIDSDIPMIRAKKSDLWMKQK